VITEAIGDGWTTDLADLQKLKRLTRDGAFRSAVGRAKREAKSKFADWLESTSGITVDPDSIFDCQISRPTCRSSSSPAKLLSRSLNEQERHRTA
jgi:starch phosphorylase